MQALILAGGKGTRLRPLTSSVPKPVLPLANRPLLSYMIDWLTGHGIDDVVISCGFMADAVKAVLGTGTDSNIRLRYIEEDQPLGTAGAVKLAKGMLEERFLVLNGDVLADYDVGALQSFHYEHSALATIALTPVDDPSAYGLVRTGEDGAVLDFLEKPKPKEIDTNLINAGAYVLERSVLEGVAEGREVSFEREVFPSLIGSGLYGLGVDGYWLDIGTPARYLQATFDILKGAVATRLSDRMVDGIGLGSDCSIDSEATLVGPLLIGSSCVIEAGARVGPLAVLGDRCKIGRDCVVEHAALHDAVELCERARVHGGIVAARARLDSDSRVEQGSVVGQDAIVGSRNLLEAGARVECGQELA